MLMFHSSNCQNQSYFKLPATLASQQILTQVYKVCNLHIDYPTREFLWNLSTRVGSLDHIRQTYSMSVSTSCHWDLLAEWLDSCTFLHRGEEFWLPHVCQPFLLSTILIFALLIGMNNAISLFWLVFYSLVFLWIWSSLYLLANPLSFSFCRLFLLGFLWFFLYQIVEIPCLF